MAKNTAVWLPRIIFGLALLGVFLVTDMYLQEAFGRGCFSPEAANELTCDEVFESGAGTFFGISNVLMGLLFYLVLAALRFGHAVVNPPRRETVRKASFALVTMGFLYSVYLTGYQFISPELKAVALCKLCLGSALTTTVLFILHIVEHRRTTTSTASRGSLALKPFIAMAALAAVLIVADVAYAKGMFGGEPASASEGATENTNDLALNGQETNPAAQIEITDPAMQCTYDPEYETLDGIEPFLDGPYLGEAGAPVRVAKIFDPNCPHCKDLHETLEEVAENNGDKARIYYIPYPIWEHSFGQIQALRMATAQGKFFPMLNLMFARQQPNGLTLDQVIEIAAEVGMDGPTFREQIEDRGATQPILADIMADRLALAEIISDEEGRVSVPKLIVDGRMIQPTYASYTTTCLEYFVNQAYAARTGVTE